MNPIPSEKFLKFCQVEDFSEPQALSGGALHHIWKVRKNNHFYVIKEINSEVVKKPNVLQNYELTETIAHQFSQNGVPAIVAITSNSHFVHTFEGSLYIVYPFVLGHVLRPEKISVAHAKIIGGIFQKMHHVNLQIKLTSFKPHYDVFSNSHWENLITHSNHPKLVQLLPNILVWNDRYQFAIPTLNENVIISHRDMHPSNVLWNDLKPSILDWESAGLTNPLQEITGFALEWAGILSSGFQNFQKEIFQTILTSYSPEGFTFSEDAFFGWLGNSVLGWTEFNIRRAFDQAFPPSEKARGLQILNDTMIPTLFKLKDLPSLF